MTGLDRPGRGGRHWGALADHGNVFTSKVAPGSADRASMIADINAGACRSRPTRGEQLCDLYWETTASQPLDETTGSRP